MKKSETTPRQRAIKDAFLRSLSAESTQIREEQLRGIAKDDPDLAAEVRALLNAAGAGNAVEQVFGFVSDPKFEATHDSELQPSSASQKSDAMAERPGTVIGHYKLLEQIGEGGMGAVFMAQQTEPIKRKVALKVIKPGMDTGQVVARFEAERQALALMDHPNIARVLDAGTTDQHRPYFVMELVRGIPITDYCSSHKLSTDARLKLFIDVCHGVQHAHQKGIIHRDLKPSNVLVTLHDGKPVVKIIDFGIAKAMNQDLTDRTLFTNFAQLIGTPLYMSPEQAELSGLDVDTRSDVYSLGVLLYELLTGSTPFDRETLKKVGIEEIRRMIRETDPPKPSQRLSTLKAQAESTLKDSQTRDFKRSQLELQGELDWIVMKSLEKERERRYESASAFAADVQRYLGDEPVQACPPSTMYRFKKFAHRNKATFTSAGFVGSALIVGTAVSVWQAVRATQAQTQAIANAVRATDQEQTAKVEAQNARKSMASEREARQSEKLERERALANEQQTKAQLYNADIRLGLVDWESGNIARLFEKLMNHLPLSGEQDLRGWDWYYLLGLCKEHEKCFMDRRSSTTATAWSPNGLFLAAISEDGKLIVYERGSWRPIKSIQSATRAPIRGLSWSPDSKSISWGCVSAINTPSEIYVQNIETDQLTLLKGSMSSVWATTWSPDGKKLASAGMDPWIRVWDLETGTCTLLTEVLHDFVDVIKWHPNGKWLLSNSTAGSNRNIVWDVATGMVVLKSPSIGKAGTASWSPDGKQMAIGTSAGACLLYNTVDWQLISEWQAHAGPIKSLSWSSNGRQLASAGEDRVIKIWDSLSATLLRTLRGSLKRVTSISWEPSGGYLASADELARIWSLSKPQSSLKLSGDVGKPKQIVWAKDGSTLKSIGTETLTRWNSANGEILEQIPIPLGTKMQFNNDGTRFVMAVPIAKYNEIQLFDAVDANYIRTLTQVPQVFNNQIRTLSPFSPDDSQLSYAVQLSIGGASNIEIVPIEGTENRIRFVERVLSPRAISWSPDGRFLATVGLGPNEDFNLRLDGHVHIFNVAKRKRVKLLRQGSTGLTSLGWSRDGKQIASGDADGLAVIWDAESGGKLMSSNIHSTPIAAMVWSPFGTRIASTSRDGSVCIWDPRTGEELLKFKLSNSGDYKLDWSADGQRLAATNGDDSIHIWDASIGYSYAQDGEFSRMFIRNQLVKATKCWEIGRKTDAKELVKQAFVGRKLEINRLPPWVMAIADNLITKSESDLTLLELFLEYLPDDPGIVDRYVLGLISANKISDAVDYLRRSFKSDKVNDEKLDSISALTLLLKQVQERDADSRLSYFAVGTTLRSNCEYAAAKVMFAQMILQASVSTRELNNIAWLLVTCPEESLRDSGLAVELAMRTVQLDPSFWGAYNTLGVALYRAGNWKESIRILEKSMELRAGGDSFDWYFLAMAHWQLNQKSDSLKWYQRALDSTDGKIPENEELARFHDEATKLLEIDAKPSDDKHFTPNSKE